MKNWFALCLVAASTTLFVAPQQADAAVAGKTYTVYVDSSVSGKFTAVAAFQTATFTLVAEDGSLGGGTFIEFGPFVFAQGGDDGDYVGEFTGLSFGNFILGNGDGNAGDNFWFYGFAGAAAAKK